MTRTKANIRSMLRRLITNSQHEVVGLLFYGIMAWLGFATIVMQGSLPDQVVRLPVRLVTTEGLKVGAPVFVQGVELGRVGQFQYLEVDQHGWPRSLDDKGRSYGQTVVTILYLKEPVQFYENYRILTKHATILSSKIVEIMPGNAVRNMNPDDPAFDNYTSFESVRPILMNDADVSRFLESGVIPRQTGAELLAATNYDDPLYQIAVVLNENRKDLKSITGNLREITQKLDRGNGNIAYLLNEPAIAGGVNDLLKSIIILTEEAREGAENLRETTPVVNFLELVLAFSGALF